MTLVPVPVEQFGGLNLRDDPEEIGLGAAVDLLNVDFDNRGRVRSRDGYLKVTASAGATRYDSVFPVSSGASVASAAATPGTMADDSSHGTIAWSPTTLTASVTLTAGATSHYLKATNFGFAVPAGATITGIIATVTRTGTAGAFVADESVRLLKAGVATGTDKAAGAYWGANGRLPAPNPTVSFGGSSDMWGTTWTAANVNGATFGFEIACSAVSAATASVSAITITVYYTPAANLLVAGASASRLDVIDTAGAVAATVATASDTRHSYVAFGSPSTSATYIANSGTTVRKLVGTTFSTPAGMPKAKFVGLQTPDNRLVTANIATIPTGAASTASTSLVHFSDAGTPETWSANNYVYLSPGDNEDIKGLVGWRDQLFIFKGSKFFVFYGNSTDSNGSPVFNYRQVTGAGMVTDQACAASPDGVYFLARDGIYFTTGGPARRISDAVTPLFVGGSLPLFVPGVINPSAFGQATMAWHDGRLYVGVPLGVATANSHTLVFDPVTDNWLVWDIPMGAMVSSGSQPALLYFTYASGTNNIGSWLVNGATADDATAITSRYRSGFSDLGFPGQEKVIRMTELTGIGSVSLGWSRDFGAITTTSTDTVTLGTSPATARKLHRKSQDGELFSWQASSVSGGAWTLNRVTPMVRDVRGPAELTT